MKKRMSISEKSKDFQSIGMFLLRARTFIALILLVIAFSLILPNVFFTQNNIIIMTKHVAIYSLLAIGMTFVIISGGIDLSVGSIVGLAGMLAGGLIYKGLVLQVFGVVLYFNVGIIIIITLIIGALVGAINGILTSMLKVPAFIATLGTMYVVRGTAMLISNGTTFPNLVGKEEYGNTGFSFLGTGSFLGLPNVIYVMVIVAIIAIYILKKTPLGWHIYALGGNEKASELSGVRVKKVRIIVYMFSGFCAALVGIIVTSQLATAHPAYGETWEMNAIASAVLGGTSMAGGIGSIGGTIIGAFVIGILSDGMVLAGVSEFWQLIIKGIVIIIAVIIDQVQRDMQANLALKRRNS